MRPTRARRVVGLVLCVAVWVTAISAHGAVSVAADVSGLAPAAAGDPSTFVSLSPARIVDTRDGLGGVAGPIRDGSTVDFAVRGQGGVPADAVSVVLNVTVVDPTSVGYASVFPSGSPVPAVSSLNFTPNRTVASLVIARIGANGAVSFYMSGGSLHVLFDVAGYFTPGTAAGRFYGAIPFRAFDSRVNPWQDGVVRPLGPGSTFTLQLRSLPLADAHWSAVMVNVTATNQTRDGYLTMYPAGAALPTASNLNFVAGQTVANAAIVKTGANSAGNVAISIHNPLGNTDFIVDVTAVFDDGTLANGFTVPSAYRALDQPQRVFDSRAFVSPFGREARTINVAGAGGAPLGALGVIMNVTATNTTAPGYLAVWPPQFDQPNVSSVNWSAGESVPNLVGVFIASSGASPGQINVFNNAGKTDVLLDVSGYFYRVS